MNDDQKLTPWIDPSVKPVHIGVYLTRGLGLRHNGVLRRWDGQFWSFMDDFDAPANFLSSREWRGLAENPNA